jgi:hypothetical protein
MAITSLDGLLAGAKQRILMTKTASRTSVANAGCSVFDLAGSPGAGTFNFASLALG